MFLTEFVVRGVWATLAAVYTLAIVKSRTVTPSETFVVQHATDLANVQLFIEGFPVQVHAQPIRAESILSRAPFCVATRMLNSPLGAVLADPLLRPYRSHVYESLFQEHAISVVLAEFGPTGMNVLPATEKMQIPLLVAFYGYDAFDHRVLCLYKNQYRKIFRSAAGCICVSHEMREQLIRLGAPAERIHLWYFGVDTDIFRPAAPKKPISPFTFLTVGRLVEKKGTLYSIEAFTRFHRQHPQSQLLIAGSGPLEKKLRSFVQQNNLVGVVHFLGSCSHDRVVDLMQKSDVLLHHAVSAKHGDREGTPVVILEAMACGMPIIATTHAGIAEVIQDGKTGHLIAERDSEAMANAMELLHEHTDHFLNVSTAARAHAVASYSKHKQNRILDSIIETVHSSFRSTRNLSS